MQPLLRQVSFKNCTRFRGRDEQEGGEPALCFDQEAKVKRFAWRGTLTVSRTRTAIT